MSKLNVKLIRDIKFSPLLFTGIVVIIAIGIALFQAAYASYLNLGLSYQQSYRRLNMADFTIDLRSAPEVVVRKIREIPGIKSVEGRIIEDIEVQLAERDSEKLTGRIISIPDETNPQIDRLLVTKGSLPKSGSTRTLVLEAGFAKYHNYHPGSFIYPVILGDATRYRITGIVKSPEYIIVVRGREYPMPSPRQFGVMFMRRTEVDRIFGTSGEINQVVATIERGANRDRIMRTAYRLLQPYGADDPVPLEKQASYELLKTDLDGLRALAIFFPLLFLSIASLSVYNLLSRMVYAQRNQIGFMRAIGYSSAAVYKHYFEFALLIGVIGSVFGSIFGFYLAGVVTRLYTSNLEVPYYDVGPRWAVILAGVLISIVVSIAAGIIPARAAAKLPPAEAIRDEIPIGSEVPGIGRRFLLMNRVSFLWRLPIRNALRSPKRSMGAVAGVVSAVVLIFVSGGLLDSSEDTIDYYFNSVQKYDVVVGFLHPQDEFVISRVRDWKGVRKVEPTLQLPAEIIRNGRSELTLVYGLSPKSRLLRFQTVTGRPIEIPDSGILMGQNTSARFDVGVGQKVLLTLPKKVVPETVDVPYTISGIPSPGSIGYRESILSLSRGALETELKKNVVVSGIIYQPIGNTITMSINQMRRIYGDALELPPNAISGAFIQADPKYVSEIRDKLFDLPGVASVEVTQYTREEIAELLKSFYTFVYVMLGFSIALAMIIMFNATIMNVIERSREISSLRTLGTPNWMMSMMITIENLIYWAIGMILGLPIGKIAAALFVRLYQSDNFNMRPIILPRTIIWTVFGILLAVLIAQLPAIRYVRHLDLAKETKEIG